MYNSICVMSYDLSYHLYNLDGKKELFYSKLSIMLVKEEFISLHIVSFFTMHPIWASSSSLHMDIYKKGN
jgi:hypothetical protein